MPPAAMNNEQLLARLVAFDSTSNRSNVPIADFICEYLDRPDVEIVRNENASGEKVSLVALVGPPLESSHGGGLLLSGHMDVVPATEPGWTSDPFKLARHDGAYYGRGTCDMKGFVALAMNVFAHVDPASLKKPLVLVLTDDEELGSLGAQRLARSWPDGQPLPRNAIIGEPTSLRVVRMHKGHLKMRITLHGRAAHSGSPHLGVNAIEPAWELLCALSELRKHLESQRTATSRYFPQTPFTVLTIAKIRGGEALNVIPERCEVDVGIRLLPGETSATVIAMIEGIAKGIAVPATVEVLGENPPMLTDEAAWVHRAMCDEISQHESLGVSYASDAGWLSRMGMDCVLFGPGTIEVAHRPDEHLPIDEFEQARVVIERMVRRSCIDAD
ncbi:MAG TPA: acetylornithine deacetylase [Phycisphaerales bacterium]|nr:acetylornithine deacetylase [Phycisphaerales bacterium]HRQ75991.1 acetylornithine deacetylase [Phycisphaerales bacterium]